MPLLRFIPVVGLLLAGCAPSPQPANGDHARGFDLEVAGQVRLPETLGYLTDFDVAADGSVAIIDGYGLTATVIDPGGAVLSLGREGSGPGELRRPRDVEISDAFVVVYDRENGTVVWDREGRLHSTEGPVGHVQLELWGDSLLMWRPRFAGLGGVGTARYAIRALRLPTVETVWEGPVAVRGGADSIGPCYGCDMIYAPTSRTLYHVQQGSGRFLSHRLGSEVATQLPATGREQPLWMHSEFSQMAASGWNQTRAAEITGRYRTPADVAPPSEGSRAPLNYEGEASALDGQGRLHTLVRTKPYENSVVDVWEKGERVATLRLPFRARLLSARGDLLYAVVDDELGVPSLFTLGLPPDL